jgi:uncharacterized protein YqjF (DUF2071 family)
MGRTATFAMLSPSPDRWSPLAAHLEPEPTIKGPPVFSIEVRDFAIVTYSVPAERIETRLPEPYELDVYRDAGGERRAFVSTTCFCNHRFRLAGIGLPRHTFNESTYRTYVTHRGRRGVYFFGRYLGTDLAWASQRALARATYRGDFEIDIERAPRSYNRFSCAVNSAAGDTMFELQALDEPGAQPPFLSSEELVEFLTYRLHGFFTTSFGMQGYMPVEHPHMRPVAGKISSARLDLWTQLGVLNAKEHQDPYSVLVVSDVPFKLFAPRPLGD